MTHVPPNIAGWTIIFVGHIEKSQANRETQLTLSTYLLFNGNCREVFEFYKSVFGGEFSIFMTFADGPADMQFPDEERDNVMHVSFPIGSSVLMGSDIPSAHGSQFSAGNNFSITHASKGREETDALFAKLSDGGTVTMPLQDTFWGSYFGSCFDKYGIPWQFDCEQQS